MYIEISLTVAQSKRLIAKGVANSQMVRTAMSDGIVAVASGSTNGYIIEEITGEVFDKKAFVTGRTLPSDYSGPDLTYTAPDLVISKGERQNISAVEAASQMRAGDVYIKGANALNYERGQAGIQIGHPTGGNVGAALGTIIANRVNYLHPVGLEKKYTWRFK